MYNRTGFATFNEEPWSCVELPTPVVTMVSQPAVIYSPSIPQPLHNRKITFSTSPHQDVDMEYFKTLRVTTEVEPLKLNVPNAGNATVDPATMSSLANTSPPSTLLSTRVVRAVSDSSASSSRFATKHCPVTKHVGRPEHNIEHSPKRALQKAAKSQCNSEKETSPLPRTAWHSCGTRSLHARASGEELSQTQATDTRNTHVHIITEADQDCQLLLAVPDSQNKPADTQKTGKLVPAAVSHVLQDCQSRGNTFSQEVGIKEQSFSVSNHDPQVASIKLPPQFVDTTPSTPDSVSSGCQDTANTTDTHDLMNEKDKEYTEPSAKRLRISNPGTSFQQLNEPKNRVFSRGMDDVKVFFCVCVLHDTSWCGYRISLNGKQKRESKVR